MWTYIPKIILRNKILILLLLGGVTLFMGYEALKIQLSYEVARVLPLNDKVHTDYEQFKKLFGEDGNVLVVGFQDQKVFQLNTYNDWYELSNKIKKIDGIKEVLSTGRFYDIGIDSSRTKFLFNPMPSERPLLQSEVDSIKKLLFDRPFYNGLILNDSAATLMAITFDKINLNSEKRISIVKKIKEEVSEFSSRNGIAMHYSGMPYIRTEFMNKVAGEMKLFLLLAFLVSTIILFIFFRSHQVVLYSSIVVLIGVICSLGTLQLLGYKITLLSGLIPPLIMIIGLPNCVFLLNKYHSELKVHGNKAKALTRSVEKMGLSLLLANITTAIGFGVFYFTNSDLLKEFGVVAAINVTITYIVSILFIPIVFSYLPVPKDEHLQNIHSKQIYNILDKIDYIVHNYRSRIYWVIALFTVVSIYGISKATVKGYLVDDLPKDHPIYTDLRFFEKNFNGVMPFEILIDTRQDKGVTAFFGSALYKMNALQKEIQKYPEFSRPISLIELLKFHYQVYRGGDPKFYRLPGAAQLKEMSESIKFSKENDLKLNPFLDSAKRIGRISYQVADVGSIRLKEIVTELRPKTDSIFKAHTYDVTFTGHSLVFVKSNDYLLNNLLESLLIAIILITMVGLALFRSLRIILLSKLPCLIPLVFTAGIMGFFDINFKPSTILIFSIAFGIASDGTIYFLTRYRQELIKTRNNSASISVTIKETGVSIIYTGIILFFGFGIFIFSGFGGTVALGILISTTILMAVCTNLVLLPALFLSIEKYIQRKDFSKRQLVEIKYEDEKESE